MLGQEKYTTNTKKYVYEYTHIDSPLSCGRARETSSRGVGVELDSAMRPTPPLSPALTGPSLALRGNARPRFCCRVRSAFRKVSFAKACYSEVVRMSVINGKLRSRQASWRGDAHTSNSPLRITDRTKAARPVPPPLDTPRNSTAISWQHFPLSSGNTEGTRFLPLYLVSTLALHSEDAAANHREEQCAYCVRPVAFCVSAVLPWPATTSGSSKG